MFTELAREYNQAFQAFRPAPPMDDRGAWEGLDPDLTARLTETAKACYPISWPEILATDYLEFSRTGNRARFEDKQFARRNLLNALILGECAQNQGAFLDDIINGIYAICGETAWQLPAHNSYIRDTPQLPLPDVTRPIVDLFAAETGAVLAAACYLMGPALDGVSTLIRTTVTDVLSRRIFTPYLTEHFWWMGDGINHMNNWTVWCTQNVLLAVFLSDLEESQQKQVFLKACQSLDYFLSEYGEDGCCDEGAQYYRHAGLCLFGCMEILNGVTGGYFDGLYQEPKICNIAAYIEKVHVDGPYYINFSDCSPVAGACNAREFLFGKRTANPALMALAAQNYRTCDDPLLLSEHNLYYRMLTVVTHKEMMTYKGTAGVSGGLAKDRDAAASGNSAASSADLYYESVGLFLARDERFCLAVKAGDNDDSHNHNDTGSFTLYKDGQPFFVDIGVETYQQKTFSPQRYEIWTMQSQYHNLPSFIGCRPEDAAACPYGYAVDFAADCTSNYTVDCTVDSAAGGSRDVQVAAIQHNGEEYAAKNVVYRLGDSKAFISMDIGDAYPDERVRSYTRQVVFTKQQGITITDQAVCAPLKPVLSLITYEEPDWNPETSTLSVGTLGSCQITGANRVCTERLPITDKRLQTAWKHDLWRTLVWFDDTLSLHLPE